MQLQQLHAYDVSHSTVIMMYVDQIGIKQENEVKIMRCELHGEQIHIYINQIH